MVDMRKESDSLGVVEVPADKLWGAQTQRSLQHFSIGKDLIPREMITAYATLKKAAATANHAGRARPYRGRDRLCVALRSIEANGYPGQSSPATRAARRPSAALV
jgi:fumarate hydratase class II